MKYRLFVVNCSIHLTLDDVHKIAFVWNVDSSSYTPSGQISGSPIQLLSRLEQMEVFSEDNLDGLVRVMKDIVEQFKNGRRPT